MAIFPALLALLLVASGPRPPLALERCHAARLEPAPHARATPAAARPPALR